MIKNSSTEAISCKVSLKESSWSLWEVSQPYCWRIYNLKDIQSNQILFVCLGQRQPSSHMLVSVTVPLMTPETELLKFLVDLLTLSRIYNNKF